MYINSGIDVTDAAYVRYSPKIFALLPVTTKIYDSVIANFFLYPFRYLKDEYDPAKEGEDLIQKDSEILKKIMGVYTTLLADSYPDVEKIKKDYPDRTKEYDTFMDKLHAVVKPKENEEDNADNADKKATENTANISTANNSTETQLKKKIEEYDAEIKKLSDIKVIPFYKPDGSENTSVQETHKKKIENLTKEKEALEAERNNLIHMYDTEIEKLQKDKPRLPGTVFYRPGPDEKNNTRNKKENTRDSDKINGEIQKLEKKKTALGTKPSVPEPNGAKPEPSAPPS